MDKGNKKGITKTNKNFRILSILNQAKLICINYKSTKSIQVIVYLILSLYN
jgi:hypothetical protein